MTRELTWLEFWPAEIGALRDQRLRAAVGESKSWACWRAGASWPMSGAIKAIVGVIAIAIGLLVPGGIWLVKVGAVLLLNAAAEALGPKPPRALPLSGIDVATQGRSSRAG